MAQHDYVIDNQTAPNFRADLNNALAAIVSTNSGGTEPSTTYANMLWYDSTANILKMRNEADDGWINLGTLDQSASFFAASVAVASQAEAEAGTNDTKTMTPLKTAQAIAELSPEPIGVGQTWQAPSRAANTTYTNSTGRPIQLLINASQASFGSFLINGTSVGTFRTGDSEWTWIAPIIPDGNTYRANFGGISAWWELR